MSSRGGDTTGSVHSSQRFRRESGARGGERSGWESARSARRPLQNAAVTNHPTSIKYMGKFFSVVIMGKSCIVFRFEIVHCGIISRPLSIFKTRKISWKNSFLSTISGEKNPHKFPTLRLETPLIRAWGTGIVLSPAPEYMSQNYITRTHPLPDYPKRGSPGT